MLNAPQHSLKSPGGGLRIRVPSPTPVSSEIDFSQVSIIVPLSWELIYKRFNSSLVGLRKGDAHIHWIQADSIPLMRNEGVRLAREAGSQWVLFIDADMTFPPEALEKLMRHDVPIVGGLCRQRRAPFAVTLWRREGKGLFRIDPEGHGLQEFDATGGAFLLVAMEVFDGIDRQAEAAGQYFVDLRNIASVPESDRCSEDIYFCNLVRACGYPLYVDLDLKIGHLVIGEIIDGQNHTPEIRLEEGAT